MKWQALSICGVVYVCFSILTAYEVTEKQIQRWAGKRYIVLIEVADVREIPSFAIDKSRYGNMDDWLPVEKIESVVIR